MGEAMIIRAGGGYNSNGGSGSGEDKNIIGWQTKSEIITTNGYFTVPKAKDQEFHVRLFGGGGGASSSGSGGGGGNMNNDTLILNQLESIQVSIGKGGSLGSVGGTTAFGSYLSATGGKYGNGSTGGDGGTGGGGYSDSNSKLNIIYSAGHGGNATYGGGGGGDDMGYGQDDWVYYNKGGLGGKYGGNGRRGGGGYSSGTNTIGMPNLDFVGEGKAYGGGGGYGGSGGNGYGGGGGYGADGGNSASITLQGASSFTATTKCVVCGGGGGYGGKGGDGYVTTSVQRAGYGGGYGPENYGRGGGSEYNEGKSGCVIVTYQAPIYKNAT